MIENDSEGICIIKKCFRITYIKLRISLIYLKNV